MKVIVPLARIRLFLVEALAVMAIAGCAADIRLSEQMNSYLEVKAQYANTIETMSGGMFGDTRRLVSIPPLSDPYAPGTYLLKSNHRLLTRSCAPLNLEEHKLPDVPDLGATGNFNLGLEVSNILGLTPSPDIHASIKRNSTAKLSFSNLTTKVASIEDLLNGTTNKKCQDILAMYSGQGVLVIDGIVSGKELIFSTKGVAVSGGAKQAAVGHFTVTYDDNGQYELKNNDSQPKFWVVSEGYIGKRNAASLDDKEIASPGFVIHEIKLESSTLETLRKGNSKN